MMNIKKIVRLSLVSFLLVTLVIGCNGKKQEFTPSVLIGKNKALHVYSAAGLSKVMDEIGSKFTKEYNIKVEYTYGGSQQLLSQIQLLNEGDVYIPGAAYYYEIAKGKELVSDRKDVALHIPVIAVPEGNPGNIKELYDLKRDGVRVVLGDEKSAAIGNLSKEVLIKNNLYEEVKKNLVATTPTVNELVVYISMKQADASIIWEDNVKGAKGIEIIPISKEKNSIKIIPISSLNCSQNKEIAERFIKFVCSNKGKSIFNKHGFTATE